MYRTLIIAKKEFQDLVNNKLVLVVILMLVSLIVLNLYNNSIQFSYNLSNGNTPKSEVLEISVALALSVLAHYGGLVAIVVGFSSIAGEKINHAFNVLLVKPVYRDTVVNGKLLGALGFIACVFGLTLLVYASGLIIILGYYISNNLEDFAVRMFLVFIILMIYVSIFVLLSMFIAILIKEQTIALVFSVIAYQVMEMLRESAVGGNIAAYLHQLYDLNSDQINYFIATMSPMGIIGIISNNEQVFNPSFSILEMITPISSNLLKLLIMLAISLVLCYLVFIRSDMS